MERLTERDGKHAYFPECFEEPCGGIGECLKSGCTLINEACERLAAYEDTGLEPEVFKKVFNEDAILKLAGQVLDVAPGRLRELSQAEKDGRLVVLPCKIGDKIHYIAENGRIDFAFVRWFDTNEGWTVAADNAPRAPLFFKFEDFGKTVFLTREEAEAALGGGEAMSKWISVKDRLPDTFVSVLVHMPGEKPLPAVHEGYLRPDGKWYSAFYEREPDEVTHWLPLPEPPEEEEHENSI